MMNTIKDRIKSAIAEEYKKYTSMPDRTDIYVNEEEVEICFDSETPYLHTKFWAMLGNVEPKLDEILNPAGFVYESYSVFYDYIVWYYKKKEDKE